MADNAFANIAAATAVGYTEQDTDRGASWAVPSERFEVVLEKHLVGAPGRRGGPPFRAVGLGSSLANAQAQALAALNFQRKARYGHDSASTSKSEDGQAHTKDVT